MIVYVKARSSQLKPYAFFLRGLTSPIEGFSLLWKRYDESHLDYCDCTAILAIDDNAQSKCNIGKIVGWGLMQDPLERGLYREPDINVYVQKAYRKMGIGTNIVKGLHDHAKQEKFNVFVRAHHTELGHKMFEKLKIKVIKPGE